MQVEVFLGLGGERSSRRCRNRHPRKGRPTCSILRSRSYCRALKGGTLRAMVSTNQIAVIGSLIGEPARAAILMALMDGQALTATELAGCANVTPQTASSHLARLTAADLLKVEKQGRHRYHRLASPDIARLLESMTQIASGAGPSRPTISVGPRDEAMRAARTCYDHIAGRLGVAIADALAAKGVVEFDDGAGIITAHGVAFLDETGIELDSRGRRSKRPLCRPCLDWSERRHHVAGKLGAAICNHFFEKNYVRRVKGTRALEISPSGRAAVRKMFGIR